MKKKIDNLYSKISNEEDARVCKAIDESACKVVPGNFFLTIISYFFNKLADSVANTKVVLPWIMHTLNVPVFLIGFLVPIRESGSLLPQLFIAAYVRKMPIRKYIWSLGAFLQAVSMFGIGIVAYTMQGLRAGYTIIALMVLFSLARGLSSVASKDVVGKTIPKTRRGMLNGYSASLAGLLVIFLGIYFLINGKKPFSAENFGVLLTIAGFFWIIASAVYAQIKEFPGETDGGGNAAIVAFKKLSILITDKPFRLFVITRAMFLCSVLSAPFYVVIAQQHSDSDTYLLGLFILSSGLASLLSAPIWGNFSDISSKKVMIIGSTITVILGFIVFFISVYEKSLLSSIYFMPTLYFLLSIGYQGIRIGRKTYLVDLAEGNKRTDYVAVSNTLIGIILLFSGFIGTLNSIIGLNGIILFLSVIGLIGVILALNLKEIEEE
ncbi:MFS transporter [Malaciobacter molluscorum LMG 25693]|uniref:MFS transporter n=1 Tax=Malaciobacter molluscorum LMG 25693 TaxID=870501 RepID=A0A2G1DF99_9BACT|nr:MFS transporter [Malaciobacter molluscorum]AXX91530.1 major facilitator superfamily transporter [Malaciobacter molluscorum LMG 25693]PHO17167.1 MFS transporter [Malaciobacter molluscorum LMG 25693]